MSKIAALSITLALGLSSQLHAEGPAPTSPSQVAVKRSLGALLPSGMYINDVQVSGQRVTVNGVGQTNQQVSDFMRATDGSGVFRMPRLETVAGDGSGGVRFTVTLEARCPKPGEQVANNPCAAEAVPSVYKCTVNGASTYQSSPCAPLRRK